jgi:hypothetical protein
VARRELRESHRLNPKVGGDVLVFDGLADLVEARHRRAAGEDADALIRTAIAAFRRARERAPQMGSATRRLAEAESLLGR